MNIKKTGGVDMGINSKIPWCTHTWNPWLGCKKVSAGCENCYMFREQRRFGLDPTEIRRTSRQSFRAPLSKKMKSKPGTIFTCSWSDFFIEEADAWRGEAWDIISQTPEQMYLILTKRPERISDNLPLIGMNNVAFGVTAENQDMFDKRMPEIDSFAGSNWLFGLKLFVSIEPMLEPIDISRWHHGIGWVIVGGESGPNARHLNPEWVRSIRDQCQAAGVPFFFKQWSNGQQKGRMLDAEFPEWARPNGGGLNETTDDSGMGRNKRRIPMDY